MYGVPTFSSIDTAAALLSVSAAVLSGRIALAGMVIKLCIAISVFITMIAVHHNPSFG